VLRQPRPDRVRTVGVNDLVRRGYIVPGCHNNVEQVLHVSKPIQASLCSIGEEITAVETTKERWCEAEVHRTAGQITLMSPEPDAAKAQEYFERALAVARRQEAKSWELRGSMSLARLWRDQGKRNDARDFHAIFSPRSTAGSPKVSPPLI
jgi:predicted ATPase